MRAWIVAVIVAAVLACAPARPARAEELLTDPYPAEGYRRGRKIRLQVVTLGWAAVEVRTARAFLAMRAAAAGDGVELAIRQGWRSHEQQAWLYELYRAGLGNKAAKPGFSNHQAGRALDLYLDPASFAWLERHARRFGFRRTVRGEPWHWEYVARPRPATRRGSAARPRRSG